MELQVDKNIYSDSCVSKVIYNLSNNYTFQRKSGTNCEIIHVIEKGAERFDEKFFWDALNDFKLREIINQETKDIKTILFAKAFGDFENLTEEDFETNI